MELNKQNSVSAMLANIGLPTIIIAVFFLLVLGLALIYDISVATLITDTIRRSGMNGIMVLAMVPSIQSGTGPNFALPVGIVCGLFGIVTAIELGFTGLSWLFMSILIGSVLAILLGIGYGKLLNSVKGSEMTIATYTGFSIVAFMCLLWVMLPYEHEQLKWLLGDGMREMVHLESIGGAQILSNLFMFNIGGIQDGPNSFTGGITIPTGMILFFLLFCLLIWLFFRSKTGMAISAGGANPIFAKASGLNVDRGRIIANVLSTVLGAIGIIIYAQGYGFSQLYLGPLLMALPAVAAILIGGATAKRAKVSHAIIGVFLFQGLLTAAMPVANEIFKGIDVSEMIRAVIQNGVILYALTQVKGGGK